MPDYKRALDVAVVAARDAGALLLSEFHRGGGPRGSGSHADADIEAETLIRSRLLAGTSWSYLGEETGAATGADTSHVWLVDPNDGTRAFLSGQRGSSVSIALLRDGVPVLGVVFAFCYPDNEGDLIAWAKGQPITRSGKPVTTRLADLQLARGAVVLVSQDGDRNPEANARCVAPARFMTLPSIAYRLALVAVGEATAAVSLSGPTSWDYAAGHALVSAAGGVLLNARGEPITYTRDGRSSSGGRVFGGAPAVAVLVTRPWNEALTEETAIASSFPVVRLAPGRAVAAPELVRRAQGCLLGQLVGDSLGSLVEFKSAAAIRTAYPGGVRDLADGGTWNLIAGQPTDDSEEALILARTICRDGGYDAGAALEGLVHWFESCPFDVGSTTTASLEAASRGRTRSERLKLAARAARQESQANGSLMRASPLGIFGWKDPRAAADLAREDSRLTHPNPACVESCAAYVAAIATALGKKADARKTYVAAIAEAERGGNPTVIEALRAAEKGSPARFDGAGSGSVLLALQNAFVQLLHAPSLEEGVVDTVSRGGDTDTTSAIAAALLGSVHGRDAVPVRWRRAALSCRPLREVGAVHPRPREFWPVDALVLAEQLVLAGESPA